jgi:hypothetical protein
VLTLMLLWENSRMAGAKAESVTILFDPDHGKTVIKLEWLLDGFGLHKVKLVKTAENDGRMKWLIAYQLPVRRKHELLSALADMPEIYAIESSSFSGF